VSSRKFQHLKHKSKAAKGSPQDPEDFVPSEEFTQMIVDQQRNGDWREIDIDDFVAELRASADLARHMEGLQAQSQFYIAKIGAPKDEDEAMTLLLRTAACGDADAQHHLGLMYATRRRQIAQEASGLRNKIHAYAEQAKKDDVEAMFWLTRAAEQKHSDSALTVGLMYDAGRGRRRNHAEAVKWIQKAANQGSDAACKWLESRER
jgi:TPR repeat protein